MSRVALRPGRVPRPAHPLEDSLAFATFAGGLITFILGMIQPAHFAASVIGVVVMKIVTNKSAQLDDCASKPAGSACGP